MAGYLDTYGESEAKREKIIKGVAIAAAILIIASGSVYFFMRDFQEKQKLNSFRELVSKKDYKAAYAMWGCTDSMPCPQYSFERFLRDWGPDSPVGKASQVSVLRTKSCTETVIQVWNIGAKEEVNLVVNRKDKLIGFAPWFMSQKQPLEATVPPLFSKLLAFLLSLGMPEDCDPHFKTP